MLRRFPSTFSLTRLFLNESIVLNRFAKTRLPPPSPVGVAAAVRPYSSDREGHKKNRKVVVVGIPNPFIWFRTRIYYFLVRTYFDKEFNIEEFSEGAKQVWKTWRQSVNLCSSTLHSVNLLLLTLAGLLPCLQTLVTVSLWSSRRSCGWRCEYQSRAMHTYFYWGIQLACVK